MIFLRVSLALSYAPAAFDRSRTEEDRRARMLEIIELLKGLGEE